MKAKGAEGNGKEQPSKRGWGFKAVFLSPGGKPYERVGVGAKPGRPPCKTPGDGRGGGKDEPNLRVR